MAERNVPSKSAGSVYTIVPEPGTAPRVSRSDVSLAAVPEIEGRANSDFSYGAVFEAPGHGLNIARGHFGPNGLVTPHKTRNLYVVFVIRGSGVLVLFGDDHKTTQIDFEAGDVIVLPPETLHQWRNGAEAFDFVGVESSSPSG